jgi:hypothetical protein
VVQGVLALDDRLAADVAPRDLPTPLQGAPPVLVGNHRLLMEQGFKQERVDTGV